MLRHQASTAMSNCSQIYSAGIAEAWWLSEYEERGGDRGLPRRLTVSPFPWAIPGCPQG
ncbi:hypothetical protein MPL3365_170200 [Mesorhizobium plurifarium]|uniref:Uncharacterized protein n=1 Tax=Mesorhizobium plurifarium TaxID=69974 RepID=A0A090G625_MESPL|nr:hypothetical protein MPL3365_170200 [Mesorhizobium plurifarium]